MYCRSELRFRNYSITFPYCRLLLFSHASKTNITATDTSRPFGQPAFQMHPMNNIACCCIVQFHIHSPRIQGRVHVPVLERVDWESDSSWDGCECSTGNKASLGSGRPVLAGSHPFHSFVMWLLRYQQWKQQSHFHVTNDVSIVVAVFL